MIRKGILIILLVLGMALNYNQLRGEKQMNILVTYSSKTGTTTEIAQYIGKELTTLGLKVDVRSIAEVKNLSSYQAVIVGAPIYAGSWNKVAREFLEKNQSQLRKVPTAIFCVGLSFNKTDQKSKDQIEKYLEKERKLISPKMEGRFMGRMDYKKLNFFEKMLCKMMGSKEGDFRDWNAIKNWTINFSKAK